MIARQVVLTDLILKGIKTLFRLHISQTESTPVLTDLILKGIKTYGNGISNHYFFSYSSN